MRRLFSVKWYLLILLIFSACSFEIPNESNGLRISVQLQQSEYCLADIIVLDASLENVSTRPILVYKYWGLLPNYHIPRDAEGAISIFDKSGKEYVIQSKWDFSQTYEKDFAVLMPGEAMTQTVEIYGTYDRGIIYSYDLHENQEYTIVVAYRNTMDVSTSVTGQIINAFIGEIETHSNFFIKTEGCPKP